LDRYVTPLPLISSGFHGRRRTDVGATRGGQEYLLERDGAALTGREERGQHRLLAAGPDRTSMIATSVGTAVISR
jgi:hypothetical protein